MNEPVYARRREVVWRLAPGRVLVRRAWPNNGEDEAADLFGPAALVWIALDEPATRADIVDRLADADQEVSDDALRTTLSRLCDNRWITSTDG